MTLHLFLNHGLNRVIYKRLLKFQNQNMICTLRMTMAPLDIPSGTTLEFKTHVETLLIDLIL
jgi:hypothetical protein